eukprot:scaffold15475_cov31-Tisochrysis_lutea.AAC.2
MKCPSTGRVHTEPTCKLECIDFQPQACRIGSPRAKRSNALAHGTCCTRCRPQLCRMCRRSSHAPPPKERTLERDDCLSTLLALSIRHTPAPQMARKSGHSRGSSNRECCNSSLLQ